MKALFLSLVITTSAYANISDFTGEFTATCTSQPQISYDLVSTLQDNTLTIEELNPEADRYTFNARFSRINEGKKIEKYDSETFGCSKRIEESTFSDSTLKYKYLTKKCLFPIVTHSDEKILTKKANGDLNLILKVGKNETNCVLLRK